MEKLLTGNLLDGVPRRASAEAFTELALAPGIRIERIVSTGHATPQGEWYEQPDDEWVMVVQGHARLSFENSDDLELKAGDHVLIPARCRHRVAWTSDGEPTIWLAVHFNNNRRDGSK